MPAARFGLPLYPGALQRYVHRLGLSQAMRLIFTAPRLSAAEMHAIGFLTEVVSVAALPQRADELAAEVAAMPSPPLRAMKRALRAAADGTARQAEHRAALRAAFDGRVVGEQLLAARARREGSHAPGSGA